MLGGLDYSEEMLSMAKQRMNIPSENKGSIRGSKDANDDVEVCLKYGDVCKPLPWDENTFDCVFHVNCFYFWPNCEVALQNISRVLKPEGIVFQSNSFGQCH